MGARVLVVDDHELMREGLRAILDDEPDLEVVGEAASGREAVAEAGALHPEVVIMDVAMKDMNGIEAARQITAGSARTRVVALSSHADPRYVQAMLRAGATAYVLKEDAFSELRRAVLRGRSYLCAGITGPVVHAIRERDDEGVAYEVLGAREREVLQLLAEGHRSAAIAERMHVSVSTVETHRRNIMRKLDLHSVAELTKFAIREGLTSIES